MQLLKRMRINDGCMMNRPTAITLEKFEAERKKLHREIEERAKADEIDRKASIFIPFIGSILFTIAIILVKYLVT